MKNDLLKAVRRISHHDWVRGFYNTGSTSLFAQLLVFTKKKEGTGHKFGT